MDYRERILQIADTPPELDQYRDWLDELDTSGPRDYLFTEKRTRFEPKREDVVVPLGALTARDHKGTTVVSCKEQGITVPVPEVSADDAQRMIDFIDGERCLLEVQLDGELAPIVIARMLRATFGVVILAPAAVKALEQRISGLEISRFPGLPYTIMRPYWANMAAVRERIPSAVPPTGALLSLLRQLHVVTLMGERLDSFFKPASPGADRLVAPGALFLDDVHLRGSLFISGPRVNAKLIGGEAYHRAVYRSVGDEGALTRTDTIEEGGLDWGKVIVARSEREPEPGPWFCPPRPVVDGHFAALRAHLAAAMEATSADDAIAAAAAFHWCFVRLHPFHNANQSLAMNLANAAIGRHGRAGIPHLVLDHFALRLRRAPYAELFARAVAAYGDPGPPAARLEALMDGNVASYRFIDAVTKHSGDDIEALIEADPRGAAFALLAP